MDVPTFQRKYNDFCDRRDRISAMVRDRARAEAVKAGVGTDIGCRLHNCLVSLHYGKPELGIDYKHAKRAAWLLKQQFKAGHVVDRWYQRVWVQVYRDNYGYKG